MKFLEWMNNKLLQSSIEPFKDFGMRNSCLCLSAQTTMEDNDFALNASKKHKYPYESAGKSHNSNYESNIFNEETYPTSEYFNGLLTIGTLGLEATISEPQTPTFAIAFEKTEVTDEELKLANYKLEKFLETEYKEHWCNESSGRASYVSAITFSRKQTEEVDDENDGKAQICPLQDYLFGSSIEMKKENAAIEREIQSKQSNKVTSQLMKKMLRKIHFPFDLQKSDSGKATDSKPTKKKIHKVLQMFRRKVHPESCLPEKGCLNSNKENSRNEKNNKLEELPDEISKFKSKLIFPQDRGHWIKTDADYLVLELRNEGI